MDERQGPGPRAATLARQYLLNEHLIHSPNSHGAALTHEGVKEIEASIKNPGQPTRHFMVQVIQNFHRNVGAVQTGSLATAVINEERES